jgi:hypothetical protein
LKFIGIPFFLLLFHSIPTRAIVLFFFFFFLIFISCTRTYFKSLRLGDEATDGGGVYGRSISLGHDLEQHKMLATVTV